MGYIRMICESQQAYARSKDIRIIYAPDSKELEMDFIPDYISQIRISLAKTLLDNESLLIGDIAQRCGVDDVAYFSSIFKKATGYTTSGWRNRKKSLNS